MHFGRWEVDADITSRPKHSTKETHPDGHFYRHYKPSVRFSPLDKKSNLIDNIKDKITGKIKWPRKRVCFVLHRCAESAEVHIWSSLCRLKMLMKYGANSLLPSHLIMPAEKSVLPVENGASCPKRGIRADPLTMNFISLHTLH